MQIPQWLHWTEVATRCAHFCDYAVHQQALKRQFSDVLTLGAVFSLMLCFEKLYLLGSQLY